METLNGMIRIRLIFYGYLLDMRNLVSSTMIDKPVDKASCRISIIIYGITKQKDVSGGKVNQSISADSIKTQKDRTKESEVDQPRKTILGTGGTADL